MSRNVAKITKGDTGGEKPNAVSEYRKYMRKYEMGRAPLKDYGKNKFAAGIKRDKIRDAYKKKIVSEQVEGMDQPEKKAQGGKVKKTYAKGGKVSYSKYGMGE